MGCSASAAASPAHDALLEPPKVEIIGERPPRIASGQFIDRTDKSLGFQDQCDCEVPKVPELTPTPESEFEENSPLKQNNWEEPPSLDKINYRNAEMKIRVLRNGSIKESKDNIENEIKESGGPEMQIGDYLNKNLKNEVIYSDEGEEENNDSSEEIKDEDKDKVINKETESFDTKDDSKENEMAKNDVEENEEESIESGKEKESKVEENEADLGGNSPSSTKPSVDSDEMTEEKSQQSSSKRERLEEGMENNENSKKHEPNILIIKNENELDENDEDALLSTAEDNSESQEYLQTNTDLNSVIYQNGDVIKGDGDINGDESQNLENPDDNGDSSDNKEQNEVSQEINEDEGRNEVIDQENAPLNENNEEENSTKTDDPDKNLNENTSSPGKEIISDENIISKSLEDKNSNEGLEDDTSNRSFDVKNDENNKERSTSSVEENGKVGSLNMASDEIQLEPRQKGQNDAVENDIVGDIREKKDLAEASLLNGNIADDTKSGESLDSPNEGDLKAEINDQSSTVVNGDDLNEEDQFDLDKKNEDILDNGTSPCHETINDILQRPATLIRKNPRRSSIDKMNSDDRG